MTVYMGKELGLERIQYEVLVLMINNLNTALTAQDALWSTLDADMATLRGVDPIIVTSDHVLPENFYPGHKPSLIEAPTDKYPNICVMAWNSGESSDQGDQYEGNLIDVYIEAMVIDGPFPQAQEFDPTAEDRVNKKVQRMTEAIHNVMISNRTLGGITFEISDSPRVVLTECLRRRAIKGHGEDYYWQMVRFDYSINKISAY